MSDDTKPQIDVRPDYGKDDDGLQPGEYAFAHNHIAGPATSRGDAMKALAGHLWDEGHVLPGDDVQACFFTWPPPAEADVQKHGTAPAT